MTPRKRRRALTVSQELIDANWEKIAQALGTKDGALAKEDVPCSVAKVASTAEGTYLIWCATLAWREETKPDPSSDSVYCDDSWDKEKVGKLLNVLIKDLGMVPVAYKVSSRLGVLSMCEISAVADLAEFCRRMQTYALPTSS